MGLDTLLTISIIHKRGESPKGAPVGINILKNELLKFINPNIITPDQTIIAIPNVIVIWVVEGKVNKKKPSKFIPKININKVVNGKT
jgi:hypothetical protein